MSASAKTSEQEWGARYSAMAEGKGVEIHSDIRRLFSEMSDQLDALVVSNFDHFHGITCGEALRAGKPVFSERPIGLNISDARQLRALAGKTKLPVSYRSPGTGHGPFRRAMELVEEGLIGEVREAHVLECPARNGPQCFARRIGAYSRRLELGSLAGTASDA